MKLHNIKRKKESKHGNRFYTQLDMSIIKHDIAVKNARDNRGETDKKGNEYICVCGCGFEGCFIHSGFESIPKDQYNEFVKNKSKHHK